MSDPQEKRDASAQAPELTPAARLGLSTAVRARIEAVGGSVRIFAQPGVGTTVLLTVPRAGSA